MECSRVMKSTASLYINIMDTIRKGVLLNVPGKLKQALMDKGLMLVSEIVWVKNNGMPIKGKRPQPSYEVIYHFAKTLDYKYYTDWMSDDDFEPETELKYSTPKTSKPAKMAEKKVVEEVEEVEEVVVPPRPNRVSMSDLWEMRLAQLEKRAAKAEAEVARMTKLYALEKLDKKGIVLSLEKKIEKAQRLAISQTVVL